MRRVLLTVITTLLVTGLFAQKLVSYELALSYTKEELKQVWKERGIKEVIVPVEYGVNIYEVIYNSTYHDGTPVKASGLYFVPQGPTESLPLLAYHHGTQIQKERKIRLGGEEALCTGFATSGYAVARPDYFGLGKGEKNHIYQHAETEAMASIDMMRAVKEMNVELGIALSDDLFITGYSQGGHASMALHKMIQEHYSDEFKITASSPMSGAYDLTGAQSEAMFREYSHPGYLPYLFYSYNEVYKMFDDPNALLKSPYDTTMPPLFNGEYKMGEINKQLPEVPSDMIKEEFVEQFLNNPDFVFTKALEMNNVYDWKPEAPMQICYCKADEQVYYKNALVAYETMRKKHGAKNVRLRHAGKKYGHNKCALFSAIYTKMYFDSFLKGSEKGRKGPVFKRFLITLSKLKIKP